MTKQKEANTVAVSGARPIIEDFSAIPMWIAVVVLPLFLWRNTVEAYVSCKELLLVALGLYIVAAGVYSYKRRGASVVRWCALDVVMILWTLLALALIPLSLNGHESMLKWFQMSVAAGVCFFMSRGGRERRSRFLQMMIVAGVLVAVFTLIEAARAWFRIDPSGDILMQMKNSLVLPLGGNNFSGAFLALCLPVTVSFLLQDVRKKILWASLVLQLAGLAACLSRTSLLAIGVWALALAVFMLGRGMGGAVLKTAGIAAAGLVLAGFVGLSVAGNRLPQLYSDLFLFNKKSSLQGMESFHMRLYWWQDTLRMVGDHPFGVGPGGFEYMHSKYRRISERFIDPETRLTTPHNDYLHALAETGFLGLGLFVSMLVSGIAVLTRAAARTGGRDAVPLAWGGVLFVGAIYALVDFPFQMPVTRFLLFAGFGAAAAVSLDSPNARTLKLPEFSRAFPVMCVGLMLYAFLAFTWVSSFAAQTHVLRVVRFSREKPAEAIREFEKAIQLDPAAKYAYTNAGTAYETLGNYKVADQMFARALRLDPNDYNAINYRGVILAKLGKTHDAMFMFLAASNVYPQFSNPHTNIGVLLQQAGKEKQAVAEYMKSLRLNRNQPEIYMELARLQMEKGNPKEAAKMLSVATRFDPGNMAVRQELGKAHAAMKAGWDKEKKESGTQPAPATGTVPAAGHP